MARHRHHRHHRRYKGHRYRPHGRRGLGLPIALIVAVIAFIVSLLLTQTAFGFKCASSEFWSSLVGSKAPVSCNVNEIVEIAVASVLLVSSLIAVNKVRAGRSDLAVWGLGILGCILVAFGIVMWFGGDWPAMVLILTGLFSGFRATRRHGIFVYQG